MADGSVDFVSLQCERRIGIRFLVKEGTTVVETVKRRKAVFAEESLSISTIYEWAKGFKEGRTSVDDNKRAGAPRTAVTREDIATVDLAIKKNRRISVLELSSNSGVRVGTIDTIIH
jgi:transposase